MKNFDIKQNIKNANENMFLNVPENVVICINKSIIDNQILQQIKNKSCYALICSEDWKSKQKKIENGKCIENCDNNSKEKYEFNGKCQENCTYYYYLDNENKYHCTQNSSCPKEFPFLSEDKKECLKNSLSKLKEYEQIYKETENEEEKIKLYNKVLESTEQAFTSENYDTSNIDNGQDDHFTLGNMRFTFTRADNQNNNNLDENMTKVHLGNCENLLRAYYNLSENVTFYMRIVDVIQEKMDISKIGFNVYCRLNGTNLEKLKLTACESQKIILSIPTKLSGDLDKLNASSSYYNDRCVSAKSGSGTDIPTKDRQIDFVENGKMVCQENCDFTYYDEGNERANCSCNFKETSSMTFDDMQIDKNKVYDNFDDTSNKKEISNLGITGCPVLGSTENIKSNPGFFSLIIILAIFVIIFIIFCTKGYNMLENKMIEVINKKFDVKNKKKKENKIKKSQTIHNKKITKRKNIKITEKNANKNKMNSETSGILKQKSVHNFIQFNIQNNITNVYDHPTTLNNNAYNSKSKPDTDYELNWLSYNEALRFDKRENCDYYGSLIRSKQLFIFTFCSFNDYNSGIIKKFMLFLSFALHYTTNALFFDDANLHQIYEDEGKYNISYQLPKIISSAVISTAVLRLMLQFLVLTDRDILYVKNQPTRDQAYNMKDERLKYMKIKFTIFFILNFILLGLFWFYLTCFNAVFKNTQIYLIENTFISFGFSLFYPFIINIFPTIFRMCSLHSANKNLACAYKVSQIIQLI